MRHISPIEVEIIVSKMNEIASDKNMTQIEKKVSIAKYLCGDYKSITGKAAEVHRSPNNRTLLAIKGEILNNPLIIKIDLTPTQVLQYLMSS